MSDNQPITITLAGKTTVVEGLIVMITVAIIARLLIPNTWPLNLNIGGKYGNAVHSIAIGTFAAAIYVGMLYSYNRLNVEVAKVFGV